MKLFSPILIMAAFLLVACSNIPSEGLQAESLQQTVQASATNPPVAKYTPTTTNIPPPTNTPTYTPTLLPTSIGNAEKIVFRSRPFQSKSSYLFTINSDGSDINPVASTEWAITPTWSPDGKKLAYAYDYYYSGSGELFITDVEGNNKRQLIDYFSSYDISWSPDSNRIVIGCNGLSNICIIDVKTGSLDQITRDIYITSPVWSPDGNKIVFASKVDDKFEIFTIDRNGNNIKQLTSNVWNNINNYSHSPNPVWSPDGQFIAFNSDRDGNVNIYVMKTDGTDVRKITHHHSEDSHPIWSPDGGKILFVSNTEGNDEVYTINSDGSDLKNLTNNKAEDGGRGFSVDWSPDSRQIVFSSTRDGNMEIYVMNTHGSNVHRLTTSEKEDDYNPRWQPTQTSD